MSNDSELEGGCLCGAVRYRVRGLFSVGYCHCSMCRRFGGAPAQVYATTRVENLTLLGAEPRVYRSSRLWQRQFCGVCGSSLFMRANEPGTVVDVAIGTLDAPEK